MAGVEEQSRPRIAIVLLLAGGSLILIGVSLILYQQQIMQSHQTPRLASSAEERISLAQAVQKVLFLLLLLVGIFSVGSLAFLRFSRRFRRWILHKPQPATPADDVWLMHRLPEESEGADDEGLSDTGGDSP